MKITLVITIAILLSVTYYTYTLQQQLLLNEIVITTIKNNNHDNIKKTLVIAYGLSEPSADCYAYMFNKYSKKYFVDWTYCAALVKVESSFNNALISNKNCYGLTQLKDSTAVAEARLMGISYRKSEPDNIAIGLHYFSRVCKTDVRAYNGGPGFLKKGYLNSNRNELDSFYVKINRERDKLYYIYKGINADTGN